MDYGSQVLALDMSRYITKLAIGTVMMVGSLMAFPVYAQTPPGSFVFVQQSQADVATSTFPNPGGGGVFEAGYTVRLGSGYVGTSTLAFVTGQFVTSSSPARYPVALIVEQFDDAAYSVNPVALCQFNASLSNGTFPGASPAFIQLNPNGCSGALLQSNKYYAVDIYFESQPGVVDWTNYYGTYNSPYVTYFIGSTTISNFTPQFALTGDGFYITPTASSTGLLLSGAQAFCDAQFGSSTNGAFGIGSDIANAFCQVGGYLFVPTPASLQQFQQLEPTMALKAPFSFVFGTVSTWDSLTASTTLSVPEYSIDLASTGIGSTTALGNILPNQMDLLSSSTINKYLPAGVHDTLYNLAEIAIALIAVAGMYEEGKRLIHT